MPQAASTIHGFTTDQALDSFDFSVLDGMFVEAWVNSHLHPEGIPSCPICSAVIVSARVQESFASGGRVRCSACSKFFTNRTNTILHGSQLTDEEVYLVAVLSAFAKRTGADVPATRREIARITGLHPDSIRNWEKIFAALETPLV